MLIRTTVVFIVAEQEKDIEVDVERLVRYTYLHYSTTSTHHGQ